MTDAGRGAPVLVLVNGIPGSGKSTLARAWCDRHGDALPLALDIDVLRAMLGGWQGALLDAGLAAREIALAAIRTHLGAGRDVVVPQWVLRPDFVDRLEHAAQRSGASFVECAVIVDHAVAARRFQDRSAAGGSVQGALEQPMDSVALDFERYLAPRSQVVRIEQEGTAALDRLDLAVAGAR